MIKLRYGNTNTYFVNGLLFDTDMPDTLPRFFRAIRQMDIPFSAVRYVMASHYHPDHMGLIRELTDRGVTHVIVAHQLSRVHFADEILKRQYGERYRPIDETRAVVITAGESRAFLKGIGIAGEILPTYSHSEDGIALMLDDGNCLAGDLEPRAYIEAYGNNPALEDDWERIAARGPGIVRFSHADEQTL